MSVKPGYKTNMKSEYLQRTVKI